MHKVCTGTSHQPSSNICFLLKTDQKEQYKLAALVSVVHLQVLGCKIGHIQQLYTVYSSQLLNLSTVLQLSLVQVPGTVHRTSPVNSAYTVHGTLAVHNKRAGTVHSTQLVHSADTAHYTPAVHSAGTVHITPPVHSAGTVHGTQLSTVKVQYTVLSCPQ